MVSTVQLSIRMVTGTQTVGTATTTTQNVAFEKARSASDGECY